MEQSVFDKEKIIGERYESKTGKYEIIEYIGKDHHRVKVRFDLTGSEVICRYDTAYKGLAYDPEYFNFMYVGKTYETSCGPVEILQYLGFYKKCDFVKIRFKLTGYEKAERLKNILKGYSFDPNYFMYTMKDKIFHSNSFGDFKIIAEAGKDANNQKMVTVEFLATGYRYDIRYDAARKGKVKDPTYFMYTVKDKIFHSNNYGEFKIIEHIGFTEDKRHRIVKIQFLSTGAIKIVKYDDALNGEVKDDTFINKYQARDLLGVTPFQEDTIDRSLKRIWRLMMVRCYDKSYQSYMSYGAKGVTVAPEWHDYNIFKRDVMNIPGWTLKCNDPLNYQLDKDLFQYYLPYNMRVYSKHTCVWLHRDHNQKIKIIGNICLYHNYIFGVDCAYYVKTPIDYLPNYGPFNTLESAINMFNYCCSFIGLDKLSIPIENNMSLEQIYQQTADRKQMIVNIIK